MSLFSNGICNLTIYVVTFFIDQKIVEVALATSMSATFLNVKASFATEPT